MTRCAGWLLSTLIPVLLISTAHAQGGRSARVHIGPELGIQAGRQFHDDEWVAGGYFRYPLLGVIDLRPGGDIALGGDHNYQLNGDLAIHGPRDLAYLGGGVAWVHRNFAAGKESATGFNVFIGFKPFPRPGAQLYVEGRWTRVESQSLIRASIGASWRF